MPARSIFLRFLHIVAVMCRHAFFYAGGECLRRWPRLGGLPLLGAWIARHTLPAPERVRVMFEQLGGTFLKFGQMLALQPDIIPLEFCDALFNLLDHVSPFPFAQVERVFEEELGRPATAIFDAVDEKPLATASVGQVHVAWLNGRKLAVKVQRPAVQTHFAGDLRLMTAAMTLIRRLRLRALTWLLEPGGEFLAWTSEEMDFRREARYMIQLRANCAGNSAERVPEVLTAFTTRRTLVSEFLEGPTILSVLRARQAGNTAALDALRDRGFDDHQVAANIINNFLGDVFRHGMFHADLHPANLMVLDNSVVGYIDFGITGTISRFSRQKLIGLTLAYTQGDLDKMCEAFFQVSAIDGSSNVPGFRQGLKRVADTWYERGGRERRLSKNFTLVMLDMLRLSRRTGIWPERDVIKYIRSAIAIDGLITRFAPAFDLRRHLESVCGRYLKWQARQELFTFHTLFNWTGAAARMSWDGPLRTTHLLGRVTQGELPARIELQMDSPQGSLRRRSLYLAGLILCASLWFVAGGAAMTPGFNAATAAAGFVTCAAVLLARCVFRLAKEQ